MVNTRASLRAESLGPDARDSASNASPRKSSRTKRGVAASSSTEVTRGLGSTFTSEVTTRDTLTRVDDATSRVDDDRLTRAQDATLTRVDDDTMITRGFHDDTMTTRGSHDTSTRGAEAPRHGGWSHTPTRATLAWLAVSLPLVAWDTAYVLLRPHSMAGGRVHWPLWVPYTLYGQVDHVYGWKAWDARNGFTGAQAFLNLVESALYVAYLWMSRERRGGAGLAVLVGFSAAVMTLSKTVLYWMNEYYGGFDNIGHNSFSTLLFLWIIPNGAWLVGSAYMICSLGSDILQGLHTAASHAKSE